MVKITIHSYKGGTGKTTITTNMANQIAREGQRVLLIETDYMMPVYHGIFTKLNPVRFFNELYETKVTRVQDLIYTVNKHLDVIFANPDFTPEDSLFRMDQDAFGRTVSQFINMISILEEQYDHILFDTSPGWSFPLIGNLIVSNFVIVILRPNIYEVRGTLKLVKELYRKTRLTQDLGIYSLFNQIPDADYGHRYEEWKNTLIKEGIRIIGEIECSCELARDLGWGVSLVEPDSYLQQALIPIIKTLTAEDY